MTTKKTEEKQLTSSERIARLENAVMGLFQTADNMARDLLLLKDAAKLIGNKLDSVVKVARAQGVDISDELIAKAMVQNNVDELAERVKDMEAQGLLVKEDSIPAEAGFVVGQELDSDGAVVNPRLQFSVASQPKDIQDKIIGAKAGDLLNIVEGKAKLLVQETYRIAMNQAPQAVPQA